MRFNDLLHLVAFPWKAHGKPPASGFVSATKMPDSRALSKLSDQFHPIHTPVRGGKPSPTAPKWTPQAGRGGGSGSGGSRSKQLLAHIYNIE